ncbi:molybdate ABC transporter substrate-binding protein [Microbaculum marinum]|uniref:Molybdate ABC transporter substrate-binding protein n=1 Tax=Microbaculum marinum TaxID=1764581 RepID=A0AAW9RT25_9HYPH
MPTRAPADRESRRKPAKGARATASGRPVVLFAAGSLKAALGEVAAAFTAETGVPVRAEFGPSGVLRKRIEGGEAADVFASANMAHPAALRDAGRTEQVFPFARNRLCAIVRPGLAVDSAGLLDAMLDPAVRVAISTPGADPSGDYAMALFDRADALRPGAAAALRAKALRLTGAPDSPAPPDGRNPYGWVIGGNRADLFLTYRTNARLAQADTPGLAIVAVPDALAVGAEYGLAVLHGASDHAADLAACILSMRGQEILRSYGFGQL